MDPIHLKLTILEKEDDRMKVEFDLPLSSSVFTVIEALGNLSESIGQMVIDHLSSLPSFESEEELTAYFEKLAFSDIS